MPKLDRLDRAIIDVLQTDARTSNVEIAERVGLSQSPCLRRIRIMEEQGVIRGYRVDLDRRALGLELTVFVAFKVARHTRENADALHQALLDIPEVVACYMISGESDFLAEVVVENLAAYESLLTERLLVLPNVTDIRSNFAIRSVKTGASLKLPPSA
ncbi:winged helix-turn-helix transcriptional regulator [Rhizobium sp. CRIBSB]|uniref:DNA-binding Lrp family transcriptional regulator n=1 Tax=Peteryoungia aggregata LMG 23059 TaxID=1368425 RepID=A0ABU0GCN5_9HYPH|nr:Lrp/AsnC family transcriptional regulator [Peteryoungia aggregata]MDQ0423105.1 DNA-binding Lrp family transcriptional regulator [Peteryoungia aggregata LMG 23059]NBB52296.1 winged helix-turn-helix transcriptional regulator [Rhizobium sp. CRIBSB]